MTSAAITWVKGGTARVVKLTADAIVLVSTTPSPPGSRIEGALEDEPATLLRVKIHGSRKQPDGSFILEGRPIDLAKELRERIVLALPAD
ncbi:MAG: hypothetical protein JWM74_4381 [Myxococcaceae bacterium]|jgi:hypothetical protein|nr:hypothetical protein [Myxococcaceae bacterium]